MPNPLLPMAVAVGLMAGLAILIKVTRGMANDRLALSLRILGVAVFLNGLESNFPTDVNRYGFGFPRKFAYDPAYVHTGRKRDKHAVSPHDHWRRDHNALSINLATWLIVGGVAMAANELVQRSRGNRPDQELDLNDPKL